MRWQNVKRVVLAATAWALLLYGPRPSLAAPEIRVAAAPQISRSGLEIRYELLGQRLRQISLLPTGLAVHGSRPRPDAVAGVEVALHCTGRNWNDHHAKKFIGGSPGTELVYAGMQSHGTELGQHVVLLQKAADVGLSVESHYQFFDGIPVVRRWTRIVNQGREPVGIEHASSAMLYNLTHYGPSDLERKMVVYYAHNSWKCEGQWQAVPPSRLGLSDNAAFNLSGVSLGNVGSWSTMWYLPMGMAENRDLGVIWFWQIEHQGAWHWELSNTANRTSYLYLGGPDELYSQAWKLLQPGASYETVPVALGCVKGGFDQAVAVLTAYRRKACVRPHRDNRQCPVIFNDYMNCLSGDPTTEKEIPLIEAAAAAGCEYYVIDAGWYAERNEKWWDSVGLWQPSKTRWSGGLKDVLDRIRGKGMVPGLWLEIEVAGIKSPLKDKPDAWFFCRHGRRVIDHGRYFLDFRNPEVRAHADEVVDRLVGRYGVGYIKMDYNVDALMGTETGADSFGQGLLEHQRAYLKWVDQVHQRWPDLVVENCSSGGGRMDYAMLSHHQLQSSSDQEDYRRYPSIVAGGLAAVVPEQFAVWSYPMLHGDADEASFNMVNAMLGRIHQSGHLALLSAESRREVVEGIRIYKQRIRPHLAQMVPFLPLGFPAMADTRSPVAVGLRGPDRALLAVWRLSGADTVKVPKPVGQHVALLYPNDRGIQVAAAADQIEVRFPRPAMAALLEVRP